MCRHVQCACKWWCHCPSWFGQAVFNCSWRSLIEMFILSLSPSSLSPSSLSLNNVIKLNVQTLHIALLIYQFKKQKTRLITQINKTRQILYQFRLAADMGCWRVFNEHIMIDFSINSWYIKRIPGFSYKDTSCIV